MISGKFSGEQQRFYDQKYTEPFKG